MTPEPPTGGEPEPRLRTVGVVLFERFELLDVCGPLELLGNLPRHFRLLTLAQASGPVASAQGPALVAQQAFADAEPLDVLLVPGGIGTRPLADDEDFLLWLRACADEAELVTSVCTGAGLLAAAGILDGKQATTNKQAFAWPASLSTQVQWQPEARWVRDGNVFTSAGVSAGMDMTLAVIASLLGDETAEAVAAAAEYDWHRDPAWDPFARLAGLVEAPEASPDD